MKKELSKFTVDFNGHEIFIAVEKDNSYTPPSDHPVNKNTKRALKKGKVAFYSVLMGLGSDDYILYAPSQIMAADEKLMLRELEDLLDEEKLLEKCLDRYNKIKDV